MSSNIFDCSVYRAAADTSVKTSLELIVWAVSLIQRGFWHTPQTRENASQTPLHTVSRKHVVQPRKNIKTLGPLNRSLVYSIYSPHVSIFFFV